jgi:hypothetical protein
MGLYQCTGHNLVTTYCKIMGGFRKFIDSFDQQRNAGIKLCVEIFSGMFINVPSMVAFLYGCQKV